VKKYQTLLWAVAAFTVFAESQPFDRYQTIIDRKPFGPEPANFDPEAAPGSASANAGAGDGEMTPEQRTAEEQQLAANVRVSILNVSPGGVVKVGFTDSSANPAENYYLSVGGSQNGWTVKSADPATESVTLEKGGVEVTVKLGEGTGGKGGAKGGAGNVAPRRGFARGEQPGAAPGRAGVGPLGRADGGAGAPPARLGGLARLRQHRMEMEAKEREAAERKREADAAIKAEQAEREARQAEREAREQEEKQRLAEERAQQREALLQIQEQLRKQREEREAAHNAEGQQGDPE